MCLLWSRMVTRQSGDEAFFFAQKSVNLPTCTHSLFHSHTHTVHVTFGSHFEEQLLCLLVFTASSESCRASSSSRLQTAEVRLPQDSVNVVVGGAAAVVAVETVLHGAGRDFGVRTWGVVVDDAVTVLAVDAGSGGDQCTGLWAADAITAVTAGRLKTQSQTDSKIVDCGGLWTVEALNKTFRFFCFFLTTDTGAVHTDCSHIYMQDVRMLQYLQMSVDSALY